MATMTYKLIYSVRNLDPGLILIESNSSLVFFIKKKKKHSTGFFRGTGMNILAILDLQKHIISWPFMMSYIIGPYSDLVHLVQAFEFTNEIVEYSLPVEQLTSNFGSRSRCSFCSLQISS